MIFKKEYFLTIFAFVFTISISAFSAVDEKDGKCIEEVKKMCPNLKMKDGLGSCLRSHKSEFSNECQEKAEKIKADLKIAFKDCKGDAKKVCAGVKWGEGRIIKCLKENAEQLSPVCKRHLENAPNL